MDICLYAKDHGISPDTAAEVAGITPLEAERVYADIEAKRAATAYGHRKPLLVEELPHIAR
jgi:NAD+ synthase